MKTFSRVAVTVSLLLGAASAEAGEGLLTKPGEIPAAARAALQKDIDAAYAADPSMFAAVRNVRSVRHEVYKRFRNPAPTATVELRSLGKGALLALLNELAFDAHPPTGLSAPEWNALVTGMLEAVGVIRDARSGPVLKAIFEGGALDPMVSRAAGEALGRLCGDAELGVLTKHAAAGDARSHGGTPPNPRREAAIRGLGHCKRVESAKQLAAVLASATDAATVDQAASALGIVGSSWAWKALGPSAEATGLAVREVAARALVTALPRHDGAARARIARAMVMVDHPVLSGLLTTARATASPELAVVIDDVQRQLTK